MLSLAARVRNVDPIHTPRSHFPGAAKAGGSRARFLMDDTYGVGATSVVPGDPSVNPLTFYRRLGATACCTLPRTACRCSCARCSHPDTAPSPGRPARPRSGGCAARRGRGRAPAPSAPPAHAPPAATRPPCRPPRRGAPGRTPRRRAPRRPHLGAPQRRPRGHMPPEWRAGGHTLRRHGGRTQRAGHGGAGGGG